MSKPSALVRNDDHAGEAPAIHVAGAFLQEQLPPRVPLVIAGRVDPRLLFARVRARGQLAEIRAAELRLTPDEVFAFFRKVTGLALMGRRPRPQAALTPRGRRPLRIDRARTGGGPRVARRPGGACVSG